jgi:hypothetical protein
MVAGVDVLLEHSGFTVRYMDVRGRRGRNRVVVGLTATYAISAYHH